MTQSELVKALARALAEAQEIEQIPVQLFIAHWLLDNNVMLLDMKDDGENGDANSKTHS